VLELEPEPELEVLSPTDIPVKPAFVELSTESPTHVKPLVTSVVIVLAINFPIFGAGVIAALSVSSVKVGRKAMFPRSEVMADREA